MVVGKLLESNQGATYGYNAATDTYEDLVAAGIIDPLKVCTLRCRPSCLQLPQQSGVLNQMQPGQTLPSAS